MDPVVLQNVTLPSEIRSVVEQVTSTEGRLALTAGVVFVTVVVALVVAPLLVRRVASVVRRSLPSGRMASSVDLVGEYVPTTIGGLFLRTIQVALVLLASVTLLTVWGLIDLAVEVLTLVGLSIPVLGQVVTTAALVLVAYVASDVLDDSIERFAEDSDRVTDHQREIILRVGNISLLALLVAGGLTVWGVDLSGLLVGAGFLGIVVGLAARQTLGSLIAGFVLMFSRPFTIGDWVEVGEKEGIVTDITIVNTRLKNFDGETIVLPNDSVSNKPIVNRSERGHLRIRQDVGIDYATDPDHAAEVALDAMRDLGPVADAPPPQVVPKSFGDSAVVLELRFWIDQPMPPRKWQAVDAVVRAIKDAFDEEDIKIPFPQQELSGRAETGGFRIRQGKPETESIRPTTERPEEARRVAGPDGDGASGNGSAGDDASTDDDTLRDGTEK
ncbi:MULTISPECIES: mechanosensitive ion channel family protein [Salinibaculum]|uniref:mechanosensitive ion channel family protein n=1 Tax=Salinibaculum TaxID=2732368 RepID=UPI0030D1D4A2